MEDMAYGNQFYGIGSPGLLTDEFDHGQSSGRLGTCKVKLKGVTHRVI
jgi:hypothetical protein